MWENTKNTVLGYKKELKININFTRIFFHINLYNKSIVKKSQKWFYALLGVKILIFAHFLKENVGKCENTVLGYKKGSKSSSDIGKKSTTPELYMNIFLSFP